MIKKILKSNDFLMKNYIYSQNFRKHSKEETKKKFDNIYGKNYYEKTPLHYTGPVEVNQIEINSDCQLKCLMCKAELSERKKLVMELDTFEKILKFMNKKGLKSTALYSISEPLLNPKLADFLDLLRKYKINGRISTNGLLLDKRMDLIFEYADVLGGMRFSIDGATKETYEKIRTPAKFHKLIKNLELFKEEDKKRKVFMNNVFINSVVSSDVKDEIAYHLKFYSRYANVLNIHVNLIDGLCPDNSYYFQHNILKNHIKKRVPCNFLRGNMTILSTGEVSVCCRDYSGDLVYADAATDDLEAALNSEKIVRLRKQHNENTIPKNYLCNNCYENKEVADYFQVFSKYLKIKYYYKWNTEQVQSEFNSFFQLFEKGTPEKEEIYALLN